jgi:simple sugar transport system permease protein
MLHDTGSSESAVVTIAALGIAFIIILALLLVLSPEPAEALYYFFVGPLLTGYHFGNLLNLASVLIFTGLGAALAFKAGLINLGGEGQIYAGAFITTIAALAVSASAGTAPVKPLFSGHTGVLVALAAGTCAGAGIAAISGLLRAFWNTDELLSSFLLAGAVIPVINYIISGPLRDQSGYLLATKEVPEQLHFRFLMPPSNLNMGIFTVIALVIITFLFLSYTTWGYRWTLCGKNREFARYGGIPVNRYLIFPMVISGGLHGAGGGMWVLGTAHRCSVGVTSGMGWNGIVTALIARNNPLLVVPSALLIAYIESGAEVAMVQTNFSFELGSLVQAVILFFITASNLVIPFYRRRRAV